MERQGHKSACLLYQHLITIPSAGLSIGACLAIPNASCRCASPELLSSLLGSPAGSSVVDYGPPAGLPQSTSLECRSPTQPWASNMPSIRSRYAQESSQDAFLAWVSGLKEEEVSGWRRKWLGDSSMIHSMHFPHPNTHLLLQLVQKKKDL